VAERVFVVTGLGYGDEGKGTTTHWLCSRHRAHTVVRTGGPQAFHRVVKADGGEHLHSQLGSGTLSGAATHLSKNMVIDPHAILTEGNALMYEHGIRNVFLTLTIHQDALVIAPFHAIANRLRELIRGDDRHGSVGVGVGETVLDAEVTGDAAIRAKDLGKPYLREKLEAIRIRKIQELEEVIERVDRLPQDAEKKARAEIENLKNSDAVQWAVERFGELAGRARIVDTEYLADILGRRGTVVFEGSQGVLLDRWYGFHPYTTKVRTVPETALSLIRECNYHGEIKSLGILRAYHTRHGAGPFVTECPTLTKQLPDANNREHSWQGSFRVGFFDAVAAKYAIGACGGEKALDGLILTCIDRVRSLGAWGICRSYTIPHAMQNNEFFLTDDGGDVIGMIIRRGCDDQQLKRQEELGKLLRQCSPRITSFAIASEESQEKVISFCSEVMEEEMNVPVVAVSVGQTEKDKIEVIPTS